MDKEPERITERELDILQLMASGKKNREIAEDLHVSEYRVEQHVRSLLDKFGATNGKELVALAVASGAVRPICQVICSRSERGTGALAWPVRLEG